MTPKSLSCTYNGFCECADLIFSHYNERIYQLLALVFSGKIAKAIAKMQQLLNYFSKKYRNSTQLLSRS